MLEKCGLYIIYTMYMYMKGFVALGLFFCDANLYRLVVEDRAPDNMRISSLNPYNAEFKNGMFKF